VAYPIRVPIVQVVQIVPNVLNGLNNLNVLNLIPTTAGSPFGDSIHGVLWTHKDRLPLFDTFHRQLLARYLRQGHLGHFF
jgi:hypothetical protein